MKVRSNTPQDLTAFSSQTSAAMGHADEQNGNAQRDRTHLTLNPMKRRPNPNSTGAGMIDTDSPLPKDVIELLKSITQERSRANDLSPSIQTLFAAAQGLQPQPNPTLLETPTPTKIIFPKNVTEEQETFAQGFQQALRQIQAQNQFIPPTPSLNSPSNLLSLLAALKSPASNLNSPVNPQLTLLDPRFTAGRVQLSPSSHSTSTTTTLSPLSSSDHSLTSLQIPVVVSTAPTPPNIVASAVPVVVTSVPTVDTTQGYSDLFQPQPDAQFQTFPQQPQMMTQPPPIVPAAQAPSRIHATVKSEPHEMPSVGYSAASSSASYQPVYSASRTSFEHDDFDMNDQEQRKLQRKRERNRLAASKCRQRKIERISELEILVREERAQTARLQQDAKRLERELENYKNLMQQHRQAGCQFDK
ncbi:BZIP domain-containing protein [Aphelenchoides besseyi]|nr:BZIP domain-containing protein [Aphelenchoides besseyi]